MSDGWARPDYDRINEVHRDPPATQGNLRKMTEQDHELLERAGADDTLWATGMGEVYQQAYTAHVLLDEAGVPSPHFSYDSDLDSRVSVLIKRLRGTEQMLHFHEASDWTTVWPMVMGYLAEVVREGKPLTQDDLATIAELKREYVVRPSMKALVAE